MEMIFNVSALLLFTIVVLAIIRKLHQWKWEYIVEVLLYINLCMATILLVATEIEVLYIFGSFFIIMPTLLLVLEKILRRYYL